MRQGIGQEMRVTMGWVIRSSRSTLYYGHDGQWWMFREDAKRFTSKKAAKLIIWYYKLADCNVIRLYRCVRAVKARGATCTPTT